MTLEATHQTEQTDSEAADAVAALAHQAEQEAGAEQRQAEQEAETGEWEDVAAQEQQARALARLGVQGVELLAGIVNPGHALDKQARENGEEALFPVALDFSGEVPEWLRPYMHYLGAGMWAGGVLVGAWKAKREADAEAERERKAEQRQAEGEPHGL